MIAFWPSRTKLPRASSQERFSRVRLSVESLEGRCQPAVWAAPDLLTQSDSGISFLDNHTRERQPQFVGSTIAPAGTMITLLIDDVPQGTHRVPSSGRSIFALRSASPLADGSHSVRFRDSRTGVISSPLTIIVDATAPAVTIDTPPIGGAGKPMTLTAQVTDNALVQSQWELVFAANGQEVDVAVGTTIAFTPTEAGTYVFRHTAYDVAGNGTAADVIVAVQENAPTEDDGINDPPVLELPQNVQAFRNQDVALGASGTLRATDVDAARLRLSFTADVGSLLIGSTQGLTFASGSGSPHLTLDGPSDVLNACLATLSYRPEPGYLGSVTITIMANDLGGTGTGGPQVVSADLTFTVVNRPPIVIAALSYPMNVNSTLTVPIPGIASAFRDPDGDPIQIRLATAPAVGTVVVSASGAFTYTPPTGFAGRVTFVVQAFDGDDLSSPLTVLIDVKPLFSLRR